MIRKLIPLALCAGALLLSTGCSKPADTEAGNPVPEVTIEEVPPPAAPDEVSVRMTERYNIGLGSTNAVVLISAEVDGVAIQTLRVNGGDCPIIAKEHRPLLNAGQQNAYTLGSRCKFHDVRRVEVGTSNGTTTFTF